MGTLGTLTYNTHALTVPHEPCDPQEVGSIFARQNGPANCHVTSSAVYSEVPQYRPSRHRVGCLKGLTPPLDHAKSLLAPLSDGQAHDLAQLTRCGFGRAHHEMLVGEVLQRAVICVPHVRRHVDTREERVGSRIRSSSRPMAPAYHAKLKLYTPVPRGLHP